MFKFACMGNGTVTRASKCKIVEKQGPCRKSAVAMGIALLFGVASVAHADDAAPSSNDWSKMFTFSGFGTLGVTHSSLGTADYTTNPFQPQGAGSTSRYNFSDDTMFGGQVNAQFTSKLSAVVQVIAQERYDNSYMPTINWANLKYAFTPNFSVRVGRIALPSFLAADYSDVGYANPWAHVPIETYDLLPVANSDGVDASYRVHLHDLSDTVQLIYGQTSVRAPSPTGAIKVTAHNLVGVFDTLEDGALTARVGYEHARIASGILPEAPISFYNVGAAYDPGNWFIQGEFSRTKLPGILPGYDSWYVIGGYRIGKFTPYALYSDQHSLHEQTIVPDSQQGQRDYSVGVRWDVYKNVDLKLQYDRVVSHGSSSGLFINEQPNFTLGSSANVVSAVLDFVF